VAGAKPYLILLPGHAFALLEADNGDDVAIECTAVGGGKGGNLGPAEDFQQALDTGEQEWANLSGAKGNGWFGFPFAKIDIEKDQADGIRAPELPDVDHAALMQMLDALVQKHHHKGTLLIAMKKWEDPGHSVTLEYPADWKPDQQKIDALRAQLPGFLFQAQDDAEKYELQAINFGSPTDVQVAVKEYRDALASTDEHITFDAPQPDNRIIDGISASRCVGSTKAAPGRPRRRAVLFIAQKGSAFFGFVICGPSASFNKGTAYFDKFLLAVHIGE
jgi:hypothetical protein